MKSHAFDHKQTRIQYMAAGPLDAPLMLFLHGFPEYWAAWQPVFSEFINDYHIVAPDQRGFNLSSKPDDVSAYDAKHLVADMAALVDHLSPDRPIILCGHDWGASVAYAFAMRHPDKIQKLVIANGVHPICFQKALYAGGAQTKASQYMSRLRQDGMAEVMSANNYHKLFNMLQGFSPTPWLDEEARKGYLQAWSRPGAVAAMLNWYRASPMIVPPPDAPPKQLEITDDMRAKYAIAMPHLLLWGMNDPALLPETRTGLEQFCADLSVVEVEGADHWIIHSHADRLVREIWKFL
jgi:pimeloyl-ACP methyl ester carboxylesterase